MRLIANVFFILLLTSLPLFAGYDTGPANSVMRVPNAGGRPQFGSIDLSKSAAVGSSILAIANGGTGQSGSTYSQAYHDSDCSWSIPNGNNFADPTADTSCTFTVQYSNNITLTSANDGTTNHNIPGITFTPVSGTVYRISAVATYSLGGSATSSKEFRFYDGTTAFFYVSQETELATASHTASTYIESLWVAPSNTAVTIKLQAQTNANTGLTWNGGQDDASNVKSIRWIITVVR